MIVREVNKKLSNKNFEGIYKSETGGTLYFALDVDVAKEYGLEEALIPFLSATYDFAKTKEHRINFDKAKVLKNPKNESKFIKLLNKEHKKGYEKIKKVNSLIKESIPKFKQKANQLKKSEEQFKKKLIEQGSFIKEQLMDSVLSPIEIKLVLNGLARCKRIAEKRGRIGLFEYLGERFEEMIEIGSDPRKAWKHASIETFCIILLIIIIICLVLEGIYIVACFINYNTDEVHNTKKVSPACKFEYMVPEKKDYTRTYEEAVERIEREHLDGCAWCMPEHHSG